MNISDALNDTIAQARANAANLVPASPPSSPTRKAQAFNMADLPGGNIADLYLKVSEAGLVVGTSGHRAVEELVVVMDTGTIQPCMAVKFGNPAKYLKTYNGEQVIGRAGTWEAALEEAARIDPKARWYPSADLTFRLEAPLVVKDQAIAGPEKLIGHSLSTTNWKRFKPFWDEVEKAGLEGQRIRVRLGHEVMTKPGVKPWGVVTFELLGPAQAN